MNNLGYPIIVIADQPGADYGEKLQAASNAAIAAGGGLLDSTAYNGCALGAPVISEAYPIIIGTISPAPSAQNQPAVVWSPPLGCPVQVASPGYNLTTPAAGPTVTAATSGGSLVDATYQVRLRYRLGSGFSAPSAYTAAVVSGGSGKGKLTVAIPPTVPYALSYDVEVGTSTSNGTWQANCLLVLNATIPPCVVTTLYTNFSQFAASANGTPAIVVHGGSSSGINCPNGNGSFTCWLQPQSAMNVSSVISTEDVGRPLLNNIFIGNFAHVGTVTAAVIDFRNVFALTRLEGVSVLGMTNSIGMNVVASNDIDFERFTLDCQYQSGCTNLNINSRQINSDGDVTKGLKFGSLLIRDSPANSSAITINGNAGYIYAQFTDSILFENTQFEQSQDGVVDFDVTNVQGMLVNAPSFQLGTSDANVTPLKLSETASCLTREIEIRDAFEATNTGGLIPFVNNTMLGVTRYLHGSGTGDYKWGADARCAVGTAESFTDGVTITADITSVGGNAQTAYGPAALGVQQVLNPGFTTGSSTVGTNWSTSCTGGGCTFTRDTTTYPANGAASQAIAVTAGSYGSVSQNPTTVASGTSYVLSFWAKNDGSDLTLASSVFDGGGTPIYCSVVDTALTTSWAFYSISCTASGSSGAAYLNLQTYSPSAGAGKIWVTGVFFGTQALASVSYFGAASQLNASGTAVNAQTTSNTGTSTNGDVTTYDAHGNTGDSGTLLSSLCESNGTNCPSAATAHFPMTGYCTGTATASANNLSVNNLGAFGSACSSTVNPYQSPVMLAAGTASKISVSCQTTGSTKTALLTIGTNPANGVTINLPGVSAATTITFVTSGATGNQVNIGANATATATALYTFLSGSSDSNLVKATYTNPSNGVVGITPVANNFALYFTTSTGADFTFVNASGTFFVFDENAAGSSDTITPVAIAYGTTTANTIVTDSTDTYTFAAGDRIGVRLYTGATETLAGCGVTFWVTTQ
ncbi:MAG: hypothetical protein ACLQVL_36840 [Terriglobia bacterium]